MVTMKQSYFAISMLATRCLFSASFVRIFEEFNAKKHFERFVADFVRALFVVVLETSRRLKALIIQIRVTTVELILPLLR